ncbi:uncharacterized protein LOC106374022 [Brassica napus]|uniref:uncharacterized protein LOC106374022 n=1 Tax=Brassica napus TaxID=3708 RepID=UPI0006AB5047|nr:uncharacterized protein LOC106374022 [Brassica napus]
MSSSFNFPRPSTKADDLEDLYKTYGVDRTVVLDLAGTHETPETVREGYYGAYLSFFHSCGLIFPIPEPILEILAELGLSLTQILPNFLRHLIAFLVKAREKGLSFGLSEFRQLVLVKQNQQNPGTFLVSPRPCRHVIEDIPYRDEKWRGQFFVFKMDRSSMGEFDFSRLPRRWAENITPSGSSSMSDEIHGLIGILRRDRSNWSTFDQARIRAIFAMLEGTDRAPLVGGSEDAELARLKEIEGDCEDLIASTAVPDWSISELDLPQVSDDSADQNMASRRSNPRDSDRVRTRTGSANVECIRSRDVSEALTEVLREETRLLRASTQEAKDLEGEKFVARVKSSSPTGSEGRDRPLKKAKTNGSDHRLGVSGEVAVAKPFHWQFSHSKDCPITEDSDSVAHLVKHFKPARCLLASWPWTSCCDFEQRRSSSDPSSM